MGDWYVYLVECADGTYYIGVTTDLERRVKEHNGELAGHKGAKYTQARRPVKLVYSEKQANRSLAQRREAALRQLQHQDKRALTIHDK